MTEETPATTAASEEAGEAAAQKEEEEAATAEAESSMLDDAGAAIDEAAGAVADVTRNSIKSFKNLFKSADQIESNKIFHELDSDNSKSASIEEMVKFIASNEELWKMLSVTLDMPPQVATKGAARVAMELATGKIGEEAMEAELTKQQFYEFRMNYIKDPAGSQEFFHRAVFAIFDTDNNGVLDEGELDKFLEILYKSGSAFQGSNVSKLPPIDQLRQIIHKHYDEDGNKEMPFEEVQSIIMGESNKELEADIAEAAAKHEAEEKERIRKEEEEEKERQRKEAEEKARKEAEEKAKKEEEEKERQRKEAEEKARKEAEEKERMRKEEEEEERKRKEAEEKAKKDAEEKAKKEEEEEQARLKEEEEANALYAKIEADKKAKEEAREAKKVEKAREEEDVARKQEEKEAIKKAQARVSMATASVMGAPSTGTKSSSFLDCSLFEYIVGLFMPPSHQITTGPAGGQLVKKESSCIIL